MKPTSASARWALACMTAAVLSFTGLPGHAAPGLPSKNVAWVAAASCTRVPGTSALGSSCC
ncbi:MAG: hypothetical protein Q8M96_12645, partial [Rubrivivax sp.]|nr:hypothetical protein [Rubrivivax sp.]